MVGSGQPRHRDLQHPAHQLQLIIKQGQKGDARDFQHAGGGVGDMALLLRRVGAQVAQVDLI